jgi:hypothetical protein
MDMLSKSKHYTENLRDSNGLYIERYQNKPPNFQFYEPMIETNLKNCNVFIERLNSVKESLQNLSCDVMTEISKATTEHSKTIEGLIEKYGTLQSKFGKIMTKNKREGTNNLAINSHNSNVDLNLEEDDLSQLIQESSNCAEFLDFCSHSEEVVKNLELLKEDIHLKKYLISSHEYFKRNRSFIDKRHRSDSDNLDEEMRTNKIYSCRQGQVEKEYNNINYFTNTNNTYKLNQQQINEMQHTRNNSSSKPSSSYNSPMENIIDPSKKLDMIRNSQFEYKNGNLYKDNSNLMKTNQMLEREKEFTNNINQTSNFNQLSQTPKLKELNSRVTKFDKFTEPKWQRSDKLREKPRSERALRENFREMLSAKQNRNFSMREKLPFKTNTINVRRSNTTRTRMNRGGRVSSQKRNPSTIKRRRRRVQNEGFNSLLEKSIHENLKKTEMLISGNNINFKSASVFEEFKDLESLNSRDSHELYKENIRESEKNKNESYHSHHQLEDMETLENSGVVPGGENSSNKNLSSRKKLKQIKKRNSNKSRISNISIPNSNELSSQTEESNSNSNTNNESSNLNKENDSDNEMESSEFEAEGERYTVRKGFPYKFYIKNLKITKYQDLSLFEGKEPCEESSEYEPRTVELEPNDTLQSVTEILNSNLVTVQKGLLREDGLLSEYLLNNLSNLLHIRTLYFSEFNMNLKPSSFNYEYFCQDENLSGSNFQNVKIVLCRRGKQPIHNLTKSCENFFKGYIKRKDKFGNCVIKGVLNFPFDKFQTYFTQKMKSFESVESIQIEVFLFRWELFRDYNLELDKTSMNRDDLVRMKNFYDHLEKLRIYDKKKKLLEGTA